jgi:hypothetical protein
VQTSRVVLRGLLWVAWVVAVLLSLVVVVAIVGGGGSSKASWQQLALALCRHS